MTEIPMVCKVCGKEGGIHERGVVEYCADAWRNAKVVHNGNSVSIKLAPLESEDSMSMWDLEDSYVAEGFACAECGAGPKPIEDLVEPAYGADLLGRLLDADGHPHGPAFVSPGQTQLRLSF